MEALFLVLAAFVALLCTGTNAEDFDTLFATHTGSIESFIVPSGVFQLDFEVEGGAIFGNAGYALSGSLAVLPYEQIDIYVAGPSSTGCGMEASYVALPDGTMILVASGANSDAGQGVYLEPLQNGGEGLNGFCNEVSYYAGQVFGVATITTPTFASRVQISWTADCSETFDILHSDYDPDLLGLSSLYIQNDEAILYLAVAIPIHYYDTVFDFNGACDILPDVTVETAGCFNYYHTRIAYNEHCTFEFYEDPDDETIAYFLGELRSNSSVLQEVDSSWTAERKVSAPINWQVELIQQITVAADVAVINEGVCVTNDDCNNNGCCTEALVCDCDCAELSNGYTGFTCEVDMEPPQCQGMPLAGGPGHNVTISVTSPRGGCVSAKEIFGDDAVAPFVTDNSGELVAYSRTYLDHPTLNLLDHVSSVSDGEMDDFLDLCFEVGEHLLAYEATDPAMMWVSCPIKIVVEDASVPFVDCGLCQVEASSESVSLCVGTGVLGDYIKQEVDHTELTTYLSVAYASAGETASFLSQFPGQMIDLTTDYDTGHLFSSNAATDAFVYLDCDCILDYSMTDDVALHHGIITNSWNSWSHPSATSASDQNALYVNASVLTAPETDGIYVVRYSAQAEDGQVGVCDIQVLYDTTPPTCDGWVSTVFTDPDNTNYTFPIGYPEPVVDATISGLESLVMSPYRVQDAVYGLPGNNVDVLNITSTYTVTDLAGNVGTCDWKLNVLRTGPCATSTCPDKPPVCSGCPASIVVYCEYPCDGTVDFTEPSFVDNQGIVTVVNNYSPGDVFPLGVTEVFYRGFDAGGQYAECNFTITVLDVVAPEFTLCPSDEVIGSGNWLEADYSYMVSAEDACCVNENITYTTPGFPAYVAALNGDGNPEGTESLALGSHGFLYEAWDDSGNRRTCTWEVTVVDDWAPYVECPADILTRIEYAQYDYKTVHYDLLELVDNVHATVTFDPPTGSMFYENTITVVTATAVDAAGNSASCNFTVEVLPGYPVAEVEAVMVSVVVRELAPDEFGATLTFVTRVTGLHRLVDGAPESSSILNGPTEIDADCNLDASWCYQTWKTNVIFDGCTLYNEAFDYSFNSLCLPGDCTHPKRPWAVRMTLSADNYCWQSLADVEIYARLTMHSVETHTMFFSSYMNGMEPVAGSAEYDTTTLFYQDQVIAGIISVETPQLITTLVRCIHVEKALFDDAALTIPVNETVVLVDNYMPTSGLVSQNAHATVASFWYSEPVIPPNTMYFAKYVAIVEVTYNLGEATNNRRRLLNLEFDGSGRQLLQSDDTSSADLSTAMTSLETNASAVLIEGGGANETDGVVILQLEECHDITSLTTSLTEVIASYLNIHEDRVTLEMDRVDSETCLVEIMIAPSECDTLSDLEDMLRDLFFGISKKGTKFHYEIANHPDIPTGTYFTPDVYYSRAPTEDVIPNSKPWYAVFATEIDMTFLVWAVLFFFCGVLFSQMIDCCITAGLCCCCFLCCAGRRRKDKEQPIIIVHPPQQQGQTIHVSRVDGGNHQRRLSGEVKKIIRKTVTDYLQPSSTRHVETVDFDSEDEGTPFARRRSVVNEDDLAMSREQKTRRIRSSTIDLDNLRGIVEQPQQKADTQDRELGSVHMRRRSVYDEFGFSENDGRLSDLPTLHVQDALAKRGRRGSIDDFGVPMENL